ncbi:MAG: SDR family oxidoreductase [Comamonadaceae bacterium]|nr:SDR family oxidoreductase [Comamonadaceae bacterium]
MLASSPDSTCAEIDTCARAALVTGGASGIGLAVVRQLLSEGWHVHVADADTSALDALRPWANLHAERVTLVTLDVCDERSVIQAVKAVRSSAPLKGVVNSAGIGKSVSFMDTTSEMFLRVLEVNLLGTFRVCHAAASEMLSGGAIVNISSGSGLRANQGRTAYGASKAAVELMSKVMAVELAAQSIRVNTVAPGPVETPLVAAMHTDADRRRALAAVPMRRYGQPQDIAQSVVFLLDEQRSGYVTGETLCVDGGFFAAGQFG